MNKKDLSNIKEHIVIFTNGLKIKKYKLCKDIPNVKYKVFTTYPTITANYSTEEIKTKLSSRLIKYFDTFINTFPSNYLKIFYKNISSVKYQEGIDKQEMLKSLFGLITSYGTTEGYYYGYTNTIYMISKKQKDLLVFLSNGENESYEDIMNNVLPHELFHLATYTTNDNVMFCGFYQNSGIYDIGNGINEGYTELLARRYFAKDRGYYDDEVIIAALVEELIGKDKMEQLYFYADLKGLITELSKYSNTNIVNRFIIDFDNYCQRPTDNLIENIFEFLMHTHENKILKDQSITNKDIVIKEYNERLLSYIKEYNQTKTISK